MEETAYIDSIITYQETTIDLLEQISKALEAKEFDQVKLLDSRLRKLNVDREIVFKKKALEEYKKRLVTKD